MADQLFEEWQIYEKLLIHDYMDHRAFFARLQVEVLNRFARPVSILDLGCGDLAPILPMLEAMPVQRYVGVDESEGALAMAARQLEKLGLYGQLVHGDLLLVLDEVPGPFDLVVASFSLHHLADPDDKLRALQRAGRLLSTDGLFALIDVFCEDGEPRESYLARWIANAESRYLELQPAEKVILFDHVHARDFPLPLETWRAFGGQAGLSRCELLLQDKEGLNCLVTLSP